MAATLGRNGMRWWASAVPCAARSCNECARAHHCVWCSGPAVTDNSSLVMPGFCEDINQIGSSTCSAGLSASVCSVEDERENVWATCRVNASSSTACLNAPGCVWCETSLSCIPIAARELCASTPAVTPGLTPDTPACASGVWSDRSNDGDARLVRVPLNISEGYREGLVCTWVFECPFNETVEVRFSRVSLERWDALRIVDGWDTTIASETVDWSSRVLAYYTSVSGDRIMPPTPEDDSHLKRLIGGVGEVGTNALNNVLTQTVDISVSVSGGRSARQAQSYGPVLSIEFKSGTSVARQLYSQHHAGVSFPGGTHAVGFEATHRCTVADAKCRDFTTCVSSSPLILWWIFAIGGLRLAYQKIFYGAKSDGLWNVDPEQLQAITVAMHHSELSGQRQNYGGKKTEHSATGELVTAITQSDQLPNDRGRDAACLALSSMEKLPADDEDHAWVDVSWSSPLFLLDVISCCACCWEGFSDFLFATLQFKRPNGDGIVTGSLSLAITAFSTVMFLSPRGQGISAGLGVHHFKTYQQAKLWVYRHAKLRNAQGNNAKKFRRLRSAADWQKWLKTPQGRHRPHDLSSHPDKDYHHIIRRPQLDGCCKTCCRQFCCCCCCRPKRSEWSPRDTWEGWSDFFDAPLLLPESDPKYQDDYDALKAEGWTPQELRHRTHATDALQVPTGERWQGDQHQVNREPGWLCGEPPTNKWDSDVDQLLYGRPPDWLMVLLTILQLRVPVEGLIAWRNVRMLKRRPCNLAERSPGHHCGLQIGRATTEVRVVDWQRARVDLDKALLREGIFEILPQTVLEFQNLWTDRMTVLDLMSVPGFPLVTWVSEYHQCYLIMLTTIITASLDLTTPYSAHSSLAGMMLYVSVVLQLTARLFVFGSMLSLRHCDEIDSLSTGMTVLYFLGTYFATLAVHKLCCNRCLYHEFDLRDRTEKQKMQYEVTVSTGVGLRAGLPEDVEVWVRLHGEKHGTESMTAMHGGSNWTSESNFASAGKASQLIESKVDLGTLTQVDLEVRRKPESLLNTGDAARVEGEDHQAVRWQCASVEVSYHHFVGVEDDSVAGCNRSASRFLGSTFACLRRRQQELQHKKTVFAAEGWVVEGKEPLELHCGEEVDGADGMDQLNMTHATASEKQLLFAFINCFTCTDRKITVAPTSLGSLLLSALRVIEAAVICWLFSPTMTIPEPTGDGVNMQACSETLAGLHVGIKSFLKAEIFLAVFLQIGSFCCLLGAAAAEKQRDRNHHANIPSANMDKYNGDATNRAERLRSNGGHKGEKPDSPGDSDASHSLAATRGCGRWRDYCRYSLGVGLLCSLLAIALAILGFALRILLNANLVNDVHERSHSDGDGGPGRPQHQPHPLAFSCRTAVLLSLFAASAVVLTCIQLAASTQLFWGRPQSNHSSCEQVTLVAVLCVFVSVAAWIGLAGEQPDYRVLAQLASMQTNQTTADLLSGPGVNDILDDIVTVIASQC